MKIRKHLIFYGRVQAVGFRYRSYHLAASLGLTGWVRNMYDGSVEMEVQGTEASIDRLIIELQKNTFIIIDNIDSENIQTQNEASFIIRDDE